MKRWTILVGGPAGQGPNLVANVISKTLADEGYHVFASRDYESRIRGGHNFNVVTFANEPISTNDSSIDLLIALDDLAFQNHKKEIDKSTEIITEPSSNILALGRVFKMLSLDFSLLDEQLKKLDRYATNIEEAKKGYILEKRKLDIELPKSNKKYKLISGGEAVAVGAIASGLDFYYAYPMTPSTSLLFELAQREIDNKHITVELESEIAVANAAIGSAIAGARAMVGTSGGGFDLMTEALSMTGAGSIPLVFYLAQRVGPGTGAPTYNSQGDLMLALHSGHGEFPRIVVAPGDPADAYEKTNELFALTQKFKVPGILLSDKHLAESFYTVNELPKIKEINSSIKWPSRFSSYISDSNAIAKSDASQIIKFVEGMKEDSKKLAKEVNSLTTFRKFGKSSSTLVIGWGSTKGAILDAIKDLPCSYLQILYLEPFSAKLIAEIKKAKKIILVENNSTAPLASLIRQKVGKEIHDKNIILRYDGRPFLGAQLAQEIKRRIK